MHPLTTIPRRLNEVRRTCARPILFLLSCFLIAIPIQLITPSCMAILNIELNEERESESSRNVAEDYRQSRCSLKHQHCWALYASPMQRCMPLPEDDSPHRREGSCSHAKLTLISLAALRLRC